MTIVNLSRTADHISTWIKDYATKAGIKTLVLGLSGGVDSALVALLCKNTGIPVLAISMPCHSSDSAYQRANAFAEDYDIKLVKIDLSKSHDDIIAQGWDKLYIEDDTKSALRSCLRAPVLSFAAHSTHGLIVGTGNRSEDHLTRYFQKFGDGCVDISPIADLFKSEVYELFVHLAKTYVGKYITVLPMRNGLPNSAFDIATAKPSADLKGPDSGQEDEKDLGLTYDEIEWADRENTRTAPMLVSGEGIVETLIDPVRHQAWHGYTNRQRTVIAKMHGLEKISRHKVNVSLPVCRLRKETIGLVR